MTESLPGVTGILLVQTADARGARLRAALSERVELEVVDEVTSTQAAIDSAERLRPEVVMMDVALDDVAGRPVLRSIRGVAPEARVILHARAADVDDAPGTQRWIERLVDVVLDPVHAAALEARLVLDHQARSVPVAREFPTDLLEQWELTRFVPASEVLASELVANAVLHVPGPCALELTHHADVLRIAVADSGPGMPDLRILGPTSEGGRGLHIVSAFSTAWGVDHLDDGGKLVWAELDPAGAEVA